MDTVKQKNIKILFRFKDNDFSQTFKRVFTDIQDLWENCEEGENLLDKAYVCQIINILAWPKFQVFQRQEGRKSLAEDEKFYRAYFFATPDEIYLNEEVDEFLEKSGLWANFEWFVYDSSIYQYNLRVYNI